MLEARDAVSSTPRAVQTLPGRTCGHCGKPIHGKRDRRYCGAKCRAMAHRARKAEKARALLRRLKDDIAELEELIGRE